MQQINYRNMAGKKGATYLFIAFFYLGLSLFCTPLKADVITLAADQWCPYNCDPSSDKPGYIIEIAKAVFEQKGHKVVYKNLPWSRAIAMARKGTLTGIIGATPSEVPDFIFPKHSQGTAKVAFFVKTGNPWQYTGIASLAGIRIGLIKDYDYGDDISEYVKSHEDSVDMAVGDDALELNIRKVIGKRLTAAIETVAVMSYYLKETQRQGQLSQAGTISMIDVYIAFSPELAESGEYGRILSDGIDEMRQSGRLNTILSKYGLSDWE